MIMMPMGDEDFDSDEMKNHHGSLGMSKAEQRRSNKPIMEKKRRARINHCLNELKSLILDAMKKDPARHSKLEKADILEMTVKHLQTVQRQQLAVAVATDPNVLHKFKSGFSECAGEVSRFIGHLEGVELGVKQRLVSHLASCVTGLQQLSPFGFGTSGLFGATSTQDSNNNTRMGGVQLVQSRLPGDISLLGSNATTSTFSTNLPSSTVTSASIGTHSSAFTAVGRNADVVNSVKSPLASPTSSNASSDDSDWHITTSRPFDAAHPYDAARKFCDADANFKFSDPDVGFKFSDPDVGFKFADPDVGFKIPPRSPAAFPSVEHTSPSQHQLVSSTVASQSPPQTFAQVKLAFKTVGVGRATQLQQPLSVVTSQVYNVPGGSKNPLDFSLKARQCVATQTPSAPTKRSFPAAFEHSSDAISSSIVSPDKVPRLTVNVGAQPGGAFYYDAARGRRREERPATSTSSPEDKDMWRPW